VNRRNQDIRSSIKLSGTPTWAVAEAMNISDNTLFRMLRKELPEQKKQQILDIIEKLKKEGANNG
jgi:hypothetical protein